MFDPNTASEFVKNIMGQLPPNLQSLSDDMKQQLQQFLQKSLNALSLVTREEFDIQSEVLAKTRAKLEALEATLKDVEDRIK